MKVSLNWLKEYIDLNGISVDELENKLTMSGLEVEGVEDQNKFYKNFIVGKVTSVEKHPNADRLALCKVNDGENDLQVVCGAPNVETGQKVVFAPVGTIIPKENFKIGKAKIRGVESFGMICAEDELELSEDHSGIMVLDKSLKEGTPVTEALGLNDVIFDIAITPNRPDALSHFGVARDIAAIYNKEFKKPEIDLKESADKVSDTASVQIEDKVNCPRYTSKVVKGIKVGESPEWLKNKLSAIGLRPINNIVDVTNYVMYETGQPLHAFDLDLLKENKIIVRSTDKETIFTTLDSKERKLPKDTLLICDAEKPVAIAGVMGGENSEIGNNTKDILIESAYFNPSSIRKTSKALGLSTEASYRFERGTDPNGTDYAAERSAQLIAELADGEILSGILDEYPDKLERLEVRLRLARIKKVLGYVIEKEKIILILKKLGFEIIFESDEEVHVKTPTNRPDIEREIDLIEEVARIHGYDNIPAVSKIPITLGRKHDEAEFVDNIKTIANGLGFYEMINNPLQSEEVASVTGNKIKILNPQSIDMQYLRTSLIPGALLSVERNLNVGEKNLSLFEIGNTFNKKDEDTKINSFKDFDEEEKIIFLITGKTGEKEWYGEPEEYDFYHLKGIVNKFLFQISLDNVLNDSYYHKADPVYEFKWNILFEKKLIGSGGKIRNDVLKKFDIEQDVYCFEFSINSLKTISTKENEFLPLLKYPKVERDFAFIFDNSIQYEDVLDFIKKNSSELLKEVKLFDLFESESLGENKKSMAFNLEFYDKNRTLKEDEVEEEFNLLIDKISKKFNAKLRGK